MPPPSSEMSWFAPASGGSQRVKPYWLTSSGTQVDPFAGLTQWNLPLYTGVYPAAATTEAGFAKLVESSTCGYLSDAGMSLSSVYLTPCWAGK